MYKFFVTRRKSRSDVHEEKGCVICWQTKPLKSSQPNMNLLTTTKLLGDVIFHILQFLPMISRIESEVPDAATYFEFMLMITMMYAIK